MEHSLNKIMILCMIMLLCPVAGFSQDKEMETRKGCIKATIKAIEMDIENYGAKLKVAESGGGPQENAAKFKAKIESLKIDLEKYRNMNPMDYLLSPSKDEAGDTDLFDNTVKFGPVQPPEKKRISVLVERKIGEDTILNMEGMSRSGPFYHVAGIVDDDYSHIRPDTTYEMTIYLVYRREYFGFIPDYYVYIEKW